MTTPVLRLCLADPGLVWFEAALAMYEDYCGGAMDARTAAALFEPDEVRILAAVRRGDVSRDAGAAVFVRRGVLALARERGKGGGDA